MKASSNFGLIGGGGFRGTNNCCPSVVDQIARKSQVVCSVHFLPLIWYYSGTSVLEAEKVIRCPTRYQ